MKDIYFDIVEWYDDLSPRKQKAVNVCASILGILAVLFTIEAIVS